MEALWSILKNTGDSNLSKHTITLIPGDGTGPELANAARRCVDALDVDIAWEIADAGECAVEKYKTPLPDVTLDSVRKNTVALKGPVTTPIGTGFRSVNVELRKRLDLYACLRPCKSYKGVRSRYQDIDLVIVRENTEDLYAGIEFANGTKEVKELIALLERIGNKKIRDGSAISIKPISGAGSARIVKYAFDYAIKNNRKKVTAVHKANIMKYTDGLFLEVAREVAKSYEGRIKFEDRIVDNMCMQLIQKPEDYDVLVLPNLYGDIISDLAAGLVGGLGVAPGANIGDGVAVFEPTHGSAPKYKGLDKVNPTALILSAALMLNHLGEYGPAKKLENACAAVIEEGKFVTYDMKRDKNDPTAVGTGRMADAIIEKIRKAK
ncbi:MAG: isocitrate/isopropylmalate dehydrogenase family protein [Candidatus Omnitrophica bacterium]|nr:isocitrate/isopropylmalate dehydrogenase family protein [Candidatus Omnitrophota bacterium]MBU0895734.1 isocitrate/isopropylmalate dehydrogenase family protein [Candidatus Omnitrophota bacterium]MBU1808309.1 isocitrate/isopropylmalate dehydrogenase family protein [Candidatus Omnitrophota bacterium]